MNKLLIFELFCEWIGKEKGKEITRCIYQSYCHGWSNGI